MGLKKKFLKSKPVCKVTFTLGGESVENADMVTIAGDFNNWDASKNPMRKLKDGSYTRTLDLDTGKDYQFKYVVNGKTWLNDAEPDALVDNGVNHEKNSVVCI